METSDAIGHADDGGQQQDQNNTTEQTVDADNQGIETSLDQDVASASDDELSAMLQQAVSELEEGDGDSDQQEPEKEIEQPQAEDEDSKQAAPDPKEQEELDKLRRQVEIEERQAQGRISELAELRKTLTQTVQTLRSGLSDKMMEDPTGGLDDHAKIKEVERTIEAIDAESDALGRKTQSQKIVAQFVKPGEATIDEIGEVLRADGVGEDYIRAFQRDPYTNASPDAIIHLAKRAKAERVLGQVVAYTKQLLEENKSLKEKPKKLINGVQKALNSPHPLTSKNGGGSSVNKFASLTSAEIANLTDEQLQEAIKAHS